MSNARTRNVFAVLLILALALFACQKPKEEARSNPESANDEAKTEAGAEGDRTASAAEPQAVMDSESGAVEEMEGDADGATDAPAAPKAKEVAGKDKQGKEDKKTGKTWKRSQVLANASKLTVGDNEDLPLKAAQITIEVAGQRARILGDYYYFNDRAQQLEGTFKLRLPTGASPNFLAFGQTAFTSKTPEVVEFFEEEDDVWRGRSEPKRVLERRERTWQEPKVARMVQKEKAALAYHDTVRRRVDPALAEWSGPGIFTTKVFPITPQQMHRVVVAYDVDLTWIGDDLTLPFDVPQAPNVAVTVLADEWAAANITTTPEAQYEAQEGVRRFRFENPTEPTIEIRLEKAVATAITGENEAGSFFAGTVSPDLPSAAASSSERAIFVVDTSMSSNPDRMNVWRAMTQAILDENRDSLKSFAILFFNVETFWWQEAFVDNTPENVAAALEFIDTLALEGASDVGSALRQAASPAWSVDDQTHDVFFLSDGASTWGDGDAHRMTATLTGSKAAAFYAYNTRMAGTDRAFLSHLTRESGGAVFSVVGEDEIKTAASAHRSRPWRIVETKIAGASDVLIAGRPTALFPGQRVGFAARGTLQEGATMELVVEQDGSQKTIKVAIPRVGSSHLAARAYGEIAVAQLEELGAATEMTAVAYARHFRIPGKSASLLMLESEADYERFNIVPENDIRVVENDLVSVVMANALQQIGKLLADPREAFFAMVRKLEAIEPIGFRPSKEVWGVLTALPADAFALPSEPMRGREHTKADMGAGYDELLRTREIDYDKITEESAKRLVKHGGVDALKALSSLVEHSPGDTVLARDIAYTAMEWEQYVPAYHLLRRVAEARPYEPQTYHALALDMAAMGRADQALAWFEVALAGEWDPRFGAFREIVSLDYLRFLRQVETGPMKLSVGEFAAKRKAELAKTFGVDNAGLLVTIGWNTDRTDVDLHVIEPTGEECYYSHPETKIGGRLTRDVTTGYGPEMYLLEKAVDGKYDIRVKYFSSDRNRASTRTKVYITIIEGWGTPDEKVTKKTVALASNQSMHDVAQVRIGK